MWACHIHGQYVYIEIFILFFPCSVCNQSATLKQKMRNIVPLISMLEYNMEYSVS
jgi:hypothetical protein